jgi:hypothetical protein
MLQGFDLSTYLFGDLRVAMSECVDTNSGIEVHVFLPGRIVEVNPFAPYYLRSVAIEMINARDQVAMLLFNYGLRSYWFSL